MKHLAVLLACFFASDLASAETPWEAYLDLPTPENAAKVTEIRYSPESAPRGGWVATDLDILELQVQAGDSEAFRLTYRLLARADGGLLEDLIAILAHSVRSRTTLFLRQMNVLEPDERTLKFILLMPGLEYVDRAEARKYEIAMRRKAIEDVRDEGLANIRVRCLALFYDN